jgi:hypothetical protein
MKLSFSAVQKYIKCGKLYNLHYNHNIREKTKGSALLFGTAIDDALNVLLNEPKRPFNEILSAYKDKWSYQEINGVNEDLARSTNVVYYNGDFDVDVLNDDDIFIIFKELENLGYEFDHKNLEKLHNELTQAKRDKVFGDDEKKIFNFISWYSLFKKGEMILEAYKEQILPRIKRVISIQKYFSVKNEVEDELIGFIDMIAEWEDGRIIRFDHKTSSTKYKDESVKESEQLATYTIATEDQHKEKTAGFIVFLKTIRKKKLPRVQIQVIIDEVPIELENKVLDQYDEACQNIKNGVYNANLQSCEDERGFKCAYYKLCHQNGDMDGLIQLDKKVKA